MHMHLRFRNPAYQTRYRCPAAGARLPPSLARVAPDLAAKEDLSSKVLDRADWGIPREAQGAAPARAGLVHPKSRLPARQASCSFSLPPLGVSILRPKRLEVCG